MASSDGLRAAPLGAAGRPARRAARTPTSSRPSLTAPRDDRGHVRKVVIRAQLHRRMHAVSDRGWEWPKYTQRPHGRAKGRQVPQASDDDDVGDGPRRERPVHPPLVIRRASRPASRRQGAAPRAQAASAEQQARPSARRRRRRRASPPEPPAAAKSANASPRAASAARGSAGRPSTRGQGAVAAADVLLELVDLGERVQRGKQGAEARAAPARAPGRSAPRSPPIPAYGVSVPNPHMLISQSAPATALSRSGGTE